MSYYKAPDDSLYYLDDDSFADSLPAGSVPITDVQAEAMKPKPDASALRVAALKTLLAASDFKVLPDYDQPDATLVAQRQAWRKEIRALQSSTSS